MLSEFDNPSYWHTRVEQVQKRIQECKDGQERDTLLALYDDYIKVAQVAEELAVHKSGQEVKLP